MYIPNHFREEDRDRLVAFMRENSFAILVTMLDGAPFATHLPLVVGDATDVVVLKGHVAKANPQWQAFLTPLPHGERLGEGAILEAMAIFHGPHAYISPTHYENTQSVPTWNYIAVHAYGTPRIVETKEATLAELIAQYEPSHQQQWDRQIEKYKQGMLNGVAFEIEVTRLEGKYKLSQNRLVDDQQRVAESLGQSGDPTIRSVAHHMQRNQPRDS